MQVSSSSDDDDNDNDDNNNDDDDDGNVGPNLFWSQNSLDHKNFRTQNKQNQFPTEV